MTTSQVPKQSLPHNREAEEALLGSVLIDPSNLIDLQDKFGIAPDDFYIVRHRYIWEAFLGLLKASQPIDMVTVSTALEHAGHLDEVGDSAYLTQLLNQSPNAYHYEGYAEIILDCSIRRKILVANNKIATQVFDETIPAVAVLEQLPGLFPDLSGTQAHIQSIEDAGLGFMQDLDNSSRAIPCHTILKDDVGHERILGITDLTNHLGGLPIGYTTLVAGATGTGKTTWGFQQAEIASILGYKVLYVSTETTGIGLIRKAACARLGISPKLLRKGEADDVVVQSLKDETNELIQAHSGKLFFDSRSTTVRGIKASIAKVCPDLVIIDHLGELSYEGDNRTIGIGENFTDLGQYCKHRGGIALVIFHHVDISVTDRPTLNDLRWAKGDLSQKADIVITLFRQDLVDAIEDPAGAIMARKQPVPVEFWIRKDREGPRDVLCKAVYDLRYQEFKTPTKEEQRTLFDV